jgi:deazaflavin-dependent oxidoreductase (nitroreductase family)
MTESENHGPDNSWNERIIAEFRANAGTVGGPFATMPMLLLTTTGARTGRQRTSPMLYLADDPGRLIVFATYAGDPKNPDWYHNLLVNPKVTVEVGEQSFPANAVVAKGAERDELWAKGVARFPVFREYRAKTNRVIPVVSLERAA